MKISIDTKEDSPEDIRKVVAMLSALVDHHVPSHLLQQEQRLGESESIVSTSSDSGLFDMFNTNKSTQESSPQPVTDVNINTMINPNSQNDDKKEDDVYKIETY